MMIRPAPQMLLKHSVLCRNDESDAADEMSGTVVRPTSLVGVVIKLLDHATEAVDNDRAVAKHYIARASALLQEDHSRASREHRATMTTKSASA